MGINFFNGHPSKSLFPKKELADAFTRVLLNEDYSDYDSDPLNQPPLTYGTDPGNYDVRKTIARWSDRHFGRKSATDPDTINLTAGASYGIANILTSCTSPDITKRVFVVSPTYYLINFAFVDAGFGGKLSAINETPGGAYDVDVTALEEQLKKYSAGVEPVTDATNVVQDPTGRGKNKYYRFVMYLVPTFSNPGGLIYSVETRQKLVELARKYDILLVSDDVYDLLNYNAAEIPSKLVHLDRDNGPSSYGNTVSNASFSKIIAPGLRVGWQECSSTALALQLASTGANKSGGTPGQLNSFVVQNLIETGTLDAIINNFNSVYRKRAEVLLEALHKHLPKTAKVYGGHGGYFLWVEVKAPGVDMRKINKLLEEKYQVSIPDGDNFEVNGDSQNWGQFGSRLCVSLLLEQDIEEGVALWAKVLREEHPELF